MIVDADRCWSRKRATVDIMMIGDMTRLCCGIEMVTISTGEDGSAKISVLELHDRSQGFDSLLGGIAI